MELQVPENVKQILYTLLKISPGLFVCLSLVSYPYGNFPSEGEAGERSPPGMGLSQDVLQASFLSFQTNNSDRPQASSNPVSDFHPFCTASWGLWRLSLLSGLELSSEGRLALHLFACAISRWQLMV